MRISIEITGPTDSRKRTLLRGIQDFLEEKLNLSDFLQITYDKQGQLTELCEWDAEWKRLP